MSRARGSPVPELRIRVLRDEPVRADRDFVLYWMVAFRRLSWNFALDRAVELARSLDKPLLVLEALRCGHRFACDRFHAFVLDGMRENGAALEGSPVRHHAYVEPEPGAGSGLLEALGERACAVVTDDFPSFMIPHMIAAAARKVPARLEAVDANGILPLRAAEKVHATAHDFRRFLQRALPEHLEVAPRARPFAGEPLRPMERLPRDVARRWPAATPALLACDPRALAALPIDHAVAPVPGVRGGSRAAEERLRAFVRERLARYRDERDQPDAGATSGLSPWLHFGHVSSHRILAAVLAQEGWSRERLARKATGSREGWWGASPAVEAFLDQLVTWREVGFNMSSKRPDEHDRYESLPAWARKTLEEHERDPRPRVYELAELEHALTHDPLWNAAQTQLVREGTIPSYLRMLWGKKVLEWSRTAREALAALLELNDRYALDGRDPNSVSGIAWCLGRYDRAWGPERPIFGKVRYMSSESAARKLRVKEYVRRHGDGAAR